MNFKMLLKNLVFKTKDFNTETIMDVDTFKVTEKDGFRCSAVGYLNPIKKEFDRTVHILKE